MEHDEQFLLKIPLGSYTRLQYLNGMNCITYNLFAKSLLLKVRLSFHLYLFANENQG